MPAPAAQNPSPMADFTRAHGRVRAEPVPGLRFTLDSLLPRPVEVYVPERTLGAITAGGDITLVVHFLGAAFVPSRAAYGATSACVVAVVNLGAGSSRYEAPFADGALFTRLTVAVAAELGRRVGPDARDVRVARMYLSAFSAGYGAVRAILGNAGTAAAVDGVILLDGLHVSYVPERTPLAEGGVLDSARLEPFVRFARLAVRGEKRMLVTHSEIFPGTFASTTETTDYLIRALGLTRTPVLAWGPGGMQQLSEVRAGRLAVLGFAGNSAPDHVDHFHGLPEFLAMLVR